MHTPPNDGTHQATADLLRDAIRQIDKSSQDAFTRIAMLSRSANRLIKAGDITDAKQELSTLLGLMQELAEDAENEINATAEGVGCNWVDEPLPVFAGASA